MISTNVISVTKEKFFECLEPTVAMQAVTFLQHSETSNQQDSLSELRSIVKFCMVMETRFNDSTSTRTLSTFNQRTQPSVMNVTTTNTTPIRTESQNDIQQIKQVLMNISTKISSTQPFNGKIMEPCKFWSQRKCTRGKRCRYLH